AVTLLAILRATFGISARIVLIGSGQPRRSTGKGRAGASGRAPRLPGRAEPKNTAMTLDELRHTAAHVLAYAVQDLFPEAKPTIGPAIENGFYYDFQRTEPFTPDDLQKLEKRMHEIVKKNYEMTGRRVERTEALDRYRDNPFKT